MTGYTDKEKELLKQYGDYMKSFGFYSLGGGINCWRFQYGEEDANRSECRESFWIVDLYCENKFRPKIYQFRWEFDGINEPELIAIQDGCGFNTCYEPKTFDEFKKRIDETVAKFGEYKKYKKQLIENKRLRTMQMDF